MLEHSQLYWDDVKPKHRSQLEYRISCTLLDTAVIYKTYLYKYE